MSQTVLERKTEHIAESAHQASRATTAVADAIEDGVGVVRRGAKQGGDAAEEFLNDTTQRLQRHLCGNRGDYLCGRLHRRSVDRLDDKTKVDHANCCPGHARGVKQTVPSDLSRKRAQF
jgi:hypothetical protein